MDNGYFNVLAPPATKIRTIIKRILAVDMLRDAISAIENPIESVIIYSSAMENTDTLGSVKFPEAAWTAIGYVDSIPGG